MTGRTDQARKALTALVFEVLLSIQSEADAQHVQVCPILAFDLPTCLVDEIQFGQVLRRLLQHACNAAAHSEPARRSIFVSTSTNPHNSIILEITNRGERPGTGNLSDQTEPRFTTDPETSTELIEFCHAVARAHGGRFELQSNVPNPGTTFRMILPPDRGSCL